MQVLLLHMYAYGILIENSLRTPISYSACTYINISTFSLRCPLDYHPISSFLMFSKVLLGNPFVNISAICSFDSTFKTLMISGLRHALTSGILLHSVWILVSFAEVLDLLKIVLLHCLQIHCIGS